MKIIQIYNVGSLSIHTFNPSFFYHESLFVSKSCTYLKFCLFNAVNATIVTLTTLKLDLVPAKFLFVLESEIYGFNYLLSWLKNEHALI